MIYERSIETVLYFNVFWSVTELQICNICLKQLNHYLSCVIHLIEIQIKESIRYITFHVQTSMGKGKKSEI
jgi:hypothetical protein